MPRLWTQTIDDHRTAVRDAVLDAAAALVADQGLAAVTMSRVAEMTGIGRATLYRYFHDVEAILLAWHERQVARHLEHLTAVRDGSGGAAEGLVAVLEAYARLSAHSGDTEAVTALHQGTHVARARRQLRDFVRDLLAEGAATGDLRDDIAAEELAAYCLHALGAAREMPSPDAVARLVAVTVTGLRPPR